MEHGLFRQPASVDDAALFHDGHCFRMLRMSASGSASSTTRSASLPASSVPKSFSLLQASAPFFVADDDGLRRRHAELDQAFDRDEACRCRPGMSGFGVPRELGQTRTVLSLRDRDDRAGLDQLLRVAAPHLDVEAEVLPLLARSASVFGPVRRLRPPSSFTLLLGLGLVLEVLLPGLSVIGVVGRDRADHLPVANQLHEIVGHLARRRGIRDAG